MRLSPASDYKAIPKHCENTILWDHIDIRFEVPAVQYQQLASKQLDESPGAIRARIIAAREVRRKRFRYHGRVCCNARMTFKQHCIFCRLDGEAGSLVSGR
jgi:predicted ATPase with chaperone activity